MCIENLLLFRIVCLRYTEYASEYIYFMSSTLTATSGDWLEEDGSDSMFEDASVSYSDDLIQAVQLQVSYVVIFHSESNLRELEELEDRLQHGNSELFVPLWKKPLLLSQLLVF